MELNSIHNDNRGSINVLVGDLTTVPEVTIFRTKAGYARGGCIHMKSREHLVVIEGMIEYFHTDQWGGSLKRIFLSGNSITIQPAIPHYYVSKTDSIVMEWGPLLEEKKGKHEAFRAIVDAINTAKDAESPNDS